VAAVISRHAAERRLLAAVLRGESVPPGREAWFREAAVRHGLAALLVSRDAGLDDAAQAVRFTAIISARTTVRSMAALEAEGVPVLALKGLPVACLAWDDPSSRVQVDVDLLVRRQDMQRAAGILERAGVAGEVVSPGEITHAATLAPAPGGAMIELHHALSDDALQEVDTEDLLARSLVVDTPEGPVRTLGLSDTAVFLTVHATFHLFDRLAWLVDLAGLARRQPVDWVDAARRARAWNVAAATEIGWREAIDVAGADIPAAALAEVHPGSVQVAIAAGLLRAAHVLEHPARRPLAVLFRLACQPSAGGFLHKLRAVRERDFS
jgi:hypothetical protein